MFTAQILYLLIACERNKIMIYNQLVCDSRYRQNDRDRTKLYRVFAQKKKFSDCYEDILYIYIVFKMIIRSQAEEKLISIRTANVNIIEL